MIVCYSQVGHLGGVRALCVYGNGVLSGATDAIVKYWSESSWTVARSFKTADGSKDTAVTSIDVCDHIVYVGYANGVLRTFSLNS
jgi:hypothetical protein